MSTKSFALVFLLLAAVGAQVRAGRGWTRRPQCFGNTALLLQRQASGFQEAHSRLAAHEARTGIPQNIPPARMPRSATTRAATPLSLPLTFEPNLGQAESQIQFVGRGGGLSIFLMTDQIGIRTADKSTLGIRVQTAINQRASSSRYQPRSGTHMLWRGAEELRGESNYFVGNDASRWRTHVPHFTRAEAANAADGVGVAIYGNDEGLEYDLRLSPGTSVSGLRLRFARARNIRLNRAGDLTMRVGSDEVTMKKPAVYQELSAESRTKRRKHHRPSGKGKPRKRRRPRKPRTQAIKRRVKAAYVLEADGSVGFRVGTYDRNAMLVIDPSLSVTYATFLGGSGTDAATSIALDSSGKIYVGGTTTSDTTFPEGTGQRVGPADGPSELFIAKIDPTVSGPNSLIYLTFLGGSGTQSGGLIAVDGSDDVAITGTTTATDFPVTDTSQPTNGLTSGYGNDVVVSEIDPTGTKLVFSTLFGGSGIESQSGSGGIALDPSGNVYIASDVSTTPVDSGSPGLPVTAGAFQTAWDGEPSDGFVAIFQPPSQSGGAVTLKYCSYLGTNSVGAPGVGGIAVDQSGNAYIAGFTGNSANGFPTKNALQSTYGGGTTDAFLMKVSAQGNGPQDVVYATLLGGSGTDEALAVAADSASTPNAYVTGTTQSPNFPTNGSTAGYQPALHQNAQSNSFLAVVAQDPTSGMTSLSYSTYLGGSEADAGRGIAVAAPNAVYIAGNTTSFDFPWLDNLQPFNGTGDAFVAKLDPTSAGTSSLLYATPLGGTSPAGGTASASAAAVAADGAGHAYVGGSTTSGDFPTAVTTAGSVNGFQLSCSSCTATGPASDAFIVQISEAAALAPSVSFTVPHLVFPAGSAAPQFVGVLNDGQAGLVISSISVTGPNAGDFSLSGQSPCIGSTIAPGPTVQCSFEVAFNSSTVGTEVATIAITDNAPGSPQLLEMTAVGGNGPVAGISPTSVGFGSQPQNTTSASQTVTLTNTGNESLNLASFNIDGTDVAQFQLEGGGANGTSGCQSGAALAAGASCVVQIAFAPVSQGSFHAELDFVDNSGNVTNAQQSVAVGGSGVAPAPIASVGPSALSFGTEAVGSSTGSQSVTLANNGSAALNLTSVTLSGPNAADFAIASNNTSCATGGGSLAIGASCTVAVQFAPQTPGAKNASLNFNDNAASGPQQISLTGTATAAPSVTLSPTSLTFGSQSEGTTSAAQSVTVSNSGASAAGIGPVTITGANAGDFVPANPCAPSLAAGANCEISVSFRPAVGSAPGARSATLNVVGATPSTVALSGAATQASVSVPTSVNFGSQLAGTAGASEPIAVANSSSGAFAGPLVVSSVTKSGTNAGDFAVTADGCTGSSTPPGGNCSLQVEFKPVPASTCGSGNGARSASLVLNDNAPGSPQNILLAGTAMDFCLNAALGQGISQPISAGQSETFNLEVDSAAGFSGSVALSCSGAPPLGTCSVSTTPATSPTTVQVSPGNPGQFQLVVTSTAPGVMAIESGHHQVYPPFLRGAWLVCATWVMLLAVCGFWLAGVSRMRASNPGRSPGKSVGACAFALALLIAVGCGGGHADPTTPAPGTPPGTYTITITATVSLTGQPSVTRTMPVMLTIQ